MRQSLQDRLFSPNPVVRLAAANAKPSKLAPFLPRSWIVNAFGAANAWVVAVGPSPGTGPGGKVDRAVPPVLGTVHPQFRHFLDNDPKGFWNELFRLLREGFRHAEVARKDKDAALKLTMAMNLLTNPQGDASQLTPEMLKKGLPRLSRVLRVTRPRIILALTKVVYKVIHEWWSDRFGGVGPDLQHPVPTKKKDGGTKTYDGRSRWLGRDNQHSILLVKMLQHPSKANSYSGNEAIVSAYVEERIAAAITG